MIIDNYYNYLTLKAFQYVYMYEDKKSIGVETLNKFRKELIKEVLDIYQNGKGYTYYEDIDQWQGEVIFAETLEEKALNDFLDEYEEYFYLENNTIYLDEDVSFKDLCELIRQVRVKEKISNRLDVIDSTKKLKTILGISTFDKIINEYSKLEKKLEELYYKLYTPEDSEKLRLKIKSLLFLRLNFLNQVASMPSYRAEAFKNAAYEYYEENDTSTYDRSPVDLDLWEDKFADPDDLLGDIDDRIYDITQYAIFGNIQNKLYLLKITEDLDQVCMNIEPEPPEEIDPNKDYTEIIETHILEQEQLKEDMINHPENFFVFNDPSVEFWVLYINYLNNLNHFIDIYGATEELLLAKKRLLYALDKPTAQIYNDDNLKKAVVETKTVKFDTEPFDFFIEEIYFMALEAFVSTNDEYTLRKLLFVGTYYNLTKDENILKIIEPYSNDPRYENFYEIMINNCVNKKEDIQKLTLKPYNKNDNQQ